MYPVADEAQLVEATQRIRRDAPAFTTSFFGSGDQIRSWIDRRALSCLETRRSLLLFRKDRDFFHLYHVASDIMALSNALDSISSCDKVLCADLVGRAPQADALSRLYLEKDFEEHTTLIRMVRVMDPAKPEEFEDPEVVFAGRHDAPRVLSLLENQLDRFSEQIPELDEIEASIERRNLLLVRDSEDLLGMLLFETQGLTSVLRYWHVKAGCLDKGIGRRLIRTYFGLCGAIRRIVLWVIGSNDASIAKYRHYGFRDEGLVDRIVIRRKP